LGNDGGVYITRDGGKGWEHMALPIGQFYTVIVDSSVTPYQVCGGLQDNGVWCGPSRTRDTVGTTDADWYPVNGGDGMWVESPPSAQVLWTGSDDGLVWLTRDGGKTWANLTGTFPKDAPTECWVGAIAASFHAAGTAFLAFDCHFRDDYRPHVYRTDDFGKT